MVNTSDLILLYSVMKRLTAATDQATQANNNLVKAKSEELKVTLERLRKEKDSLIQQRQFNQTSIESMKKVLENVKKATIQAFEKENIIKSKSEGLTGLDKAAAESGLGDVYSTQITNEKARIEASAILQKSKANEASAEQREIEISKETMALQSAGNITNPNIGPNVLMAATVIYKGLEALFDKFMAPGQELSKELKTAGLPSMVKAFNTVADPLIDMAEIISDSISPAFIPMIEKLAEGMEGLMDETVEIKDANGDLIETISPLEQVVRDITPVMTSAGDALVQLVPQIPAMIAVWVKFAAVNWEGLVNFLINNGDFILTLLNDTVNMLRDIYNLFNVNLREPDGWLNWIKSLNAFNPNDIGKIAGGGR